MPGKTNADGEILDVGTGAGLPGIPLKLLFPELPITLVEPRAKRTTFLKIAVERLGLSRVTIARCRLEELEPGRYDYVISKAFRAPLTWLELAEERVAAGGTIVCLTRPEVRGDLVERAESLQLRLRDACDDTTELGAPSVGEKRAIYAFSKPS
jgi:16S rRNA (guanine527-N7)-methyltransferase